MDFKIVDKYLDSCFQELLRQINRLQSGGTIDSLNTIGVNTTHQIGASFVSLKQLASKYSPNEPLALLLWNTQKREQQIVSCMILPENTNKEKITQLIQTCLDFEIAEYFGSLYLQKHPQLTEVSANWLDSENPFQQTAALTALARYLILHKKNNKTQTELFQAAIRRNFKDKYVQLLVNRYRFNI